MASITYPKAAHDKAVELGQSLANAEPDIVYWWDATIGGFFDGLRCCLPSEAVGILMVIHDDALEHFLKLKQEA